MAALRDKSRDSNDYEMFCLIYVLVEFSLILAAVVSRFKYRLPRFPGARHIYDEQVGFDFAAMTALFGIFFILIVTIPALFFAAAYLVQWRQHKLRQRYRIFGLLILGAVLWFPAVISMLAYSH